MHYVILHIKNTETFKKNIYHIRKVNALEIPILPCCFYIPPCGCLPNPPIFFFFLCQTFLPNAYVVVTFFGNKILYLPKKQFNTWRS